MKRCLNSRAASGFSLVEVTLAVAIAALAIITLLGLLPQGLEMSRKTALMTSNSNILEQVARDLDNAYFDKLPTQILTKYFSDQGAEVKSESKDIVYVVQIDPDVQNPASLPKSAANQLYLKRFIIRIATSSDPNFKFGENNRISYSTYSHLVAKTRSLVP